MADVKLTLGNELPQGTTVKIKYNGVVVATGEEVSGTQIYLSRLLPEGKRQPITEYKDKVDIWEITVYPNKAVDTIVTIESVMSKDNFTREKVIAWGRANLSI